MELELLKENFRKHVEKYDVEDLSINLKFYHSYRVMDLSMLIAKYSNLNEEDQQIAMIIGLLHDYARFEQWTKYKTFSDLKSIDHGDLAVKLLFEDNEIKDYCLNSDYYDEIYDAIKYHNKYEYPSFLSDHNKLFCKIIRDADKIDILYLIGIKESFVKEDYEPISVKVKNDFYTRKQINRKDVLNDSDDVVLFLAMVFDLNMDYSFEYIKKFKLIEKIFDSIKNKDKYKPYFDFAINYINERIGNNVR